MVSNVIVTFDVAIARRCKWTETDAGLVCAALTAGYSEGTVSC